MIRLKSSIRSIRDPWDTMIQRYNDDYIGVRLFATGIGTLRIADEKIFLIDRSKRFCWCMFYLCPEKTAAYEINRGRVATVIVRSHLIPH